MKLSKEIKTAILVISSVLLFIWGYSFLKGTDILSNHKTFYVLYDDVEGLLPSAPVTINGLAIGKVKSISFLNKSGKLKVELQIDTDFEIAKSSEARIYEPGLIGGKQIQIVPNLNDTNFAHDGDYLKGGVKPGLTELVSERLTPLQEKIEKAMVSADGVLLNINTLLDEKAKKDLKNSFAELNETLTALSQASNSANEIVTNNKGKLNNVVDNFEKVSSNFEKLSDSLAQSNLKQTVENLEKTLVNVNKIIANVEAGNGTMGKLLNDDKMYTNFTKASKELELLLQDLRLNPTRYVNVSLFGKKNKPYVAPTETDSTKNKN
ncbi:MAG: MCE family protein [Flavobacterium sp.]|uniref:MlaD family protein n=1 Tax=Flavobacterium sp. TaxID=239 RepID=UPI001D27EFE8|nr:MCE family protein [Flavobacterium sp.]